jgi:DNA-directed RNA polymerase III subunit RPC6
MLYDVIPAKEITGGPWYTELEFDHEFISELRIFIVRCVKGLNKGKGVTLAEITDKMKQFSVSRVQLGLEDIQQLIQTLAFDYLIEQSDINEAGEALFIAAKRVSTMCDFKCEFIICMH